jgi:hypothetical protein
MRGTRCTARTTLALYPLEPHSARSVRFFLALSLDQAIAHSGFLDSPYGRRGAVRVPASSDQTWIGRLGHRRLPDLGERLGIGIDHWAAED